MMTAFPSNTSHDPQLLLDLWYRWRAGEDAQPPREPWQDAPDSQIKEWEQDLDTFFVALTKPEQDV